MKKNREAFFESSYMNQANFPNMPIANQPFTTSSYANQGFYAGNAMPYNYTTQNTQNSNYIDYNDLESRLSKIERQLNRIDARLNKLENSNLYSSIDSDNTNNIYMV